MVIDALGLSAYEEPACEFTNVNLEETLCELLDYATQKGLIEDSTVHRDLFDTKLMGLIMPRPSEVIKTFNEKYKISPK